MFCVVFTMFNHGAAGQPVDLHRLSTDALSEGASVAATYLLYADYLRNPDTFHDCEITAFLLANIGEYANADSLLQKVQSLKNVDTLDDSLKYYFYASRAMIEHSKSKYYEALESLSKIKQNERLAETMADCYKELGLYDKAKAVYLENVSNENKTHFYNLIGDCLRVWGKYSEAIKFFSLAIDEDPYDAFPYYGAGWSYELSGDDETALQFYNKGLEVDQSYAYIHLLRGELYLKMGKEEQAKADFKEVLRLDKTIKDGSARHYALFFLGRGNDALNWINNIIEYQPDMPGPYYDKACLCCHMELYEDAIKAIEIALKKGYRAFAHLDADDDINPIRNRPEYTIIYNKYHDQYLSELERLNRVL